ncbi:MAG TPA: NTPase [Candidatus Acidoferrales bacterium]|nr:NTPase [Candidatus Acidoferrales bacterium]
MRLLLTGAPGIGKTTVVRATLARLGKFCCAGFYTEERRHQGRRVAFKIVTLDGAEATLAAVGGGQPRVGKYAVHVKEFEDLALPEINPDLTPADLYVIDEIGKMELLSPRFRSSLIDLLARPTNLLATIAKRGKGFLEQIKGRNDIDLVEVTRENRDRLPEQIAARIERELGMRALP